MGRSDHGAEPAAVIVAVEGPTAAGKTTWCRQQRLPVVDEYAPTGDEPDGADQDQQAAYWVQVNSQRWRQAIDLEKQHPIVLCDSDPLKLHYSWVWRESAPHPGPGFTTNCGMCERLWTPVVSDSPTSCLSQFHRYTCCAAAETQTLPVNGDRSTSTRN
jgi:hypothetical protein